MIMKKMLKKNFQVGLSGIREADKILAYSK